MFHVIETGKCAKHDIPWVEIDMPESEIAIRTADTTIGEETFVTTWKSPVNARVCPECVRGTVYEQFLPKTYGEAK